MGRLARFIPSDAYFHILSRGNNRQNVFFKDEDYEKFLEFLKLFAEKFVWKIIHYVLMSNHYHIILFNSISENLSNGIKLLNQSYTRYFRQKHDGVGHLWQDRFRSFVIQDGKYLIECGKYIELNPVMAGIVELPENYKWSSYNFYAFGIDSKLLQPSVEYFGLSEDKNSQQKLYREFVMAGTKEKRGIERYFRQGFYGTAEFEENLKSRGLESKGWKSGPKNGRAVTKISEQIEKWNL